MTAVPGVGALALPLPDELDWPPPLEAPEDPADEPPDEEDDDAAGESLSCCEKGSLLANMPNDESWPSATGGAVDEASDGSAEGVDAGVSPPPREGAARLGVPPVVVVFSLYDTAAGVFEGCSCVHNFGPWKAATARKTTPRPPAMIFCLFCFALSESTRLFAIYGAPVADALLEGVPPVVVVSVVEEGVLAAGGVAAGTGAGEAAYTNASITSVA